MAINKAKPAPPRQREMVTSTLAQRILSGEFSPGSRLPTEAEMSEEMAVSRTALRESVRTLAGKGLIESRPRIGTVVLPSEQWNHLDSDILAWRERLPPDVNFIRALTEARQVIEPAAAEMAALRADGTDLGRIQTAYDRMCAGQTDDIESTVEADEDFHLSILMASKNEIFANFGAVIGSALRMSFRLTTPSAQNFSASLDTHGAVLEAIRMRDSAKSRDLMAGLIALAARELNTLAARTTSAPKPDP
ncbi:FadR/GntR family transcriptional regulator [Tritonibacter horizontis]|uniref:Putative L-lactate dehydrogenase operon regulatory protein n=1 Tax=Tritonibacter horizontis TaxID=1768241 RepID=A0A132C227_9RHOB|nr:FadR/GntR family transcriptional regulator [Tritonibacter horizontis]KUP94639.1 putative L-lactate dehydrogenase operon regulatory protein [Tritonibacter horizontis]